MNPGDEQFLRNVRTRLRNRSKTEYPGPWPGRTWTSSPAIESPRRPSSESPKEGLRSAAGCLIDRFTVELANVGGYAERVATPAQLLTKLEDLRARLNLEQIMCEDPNESADGSESASWIAAIQLAGRVSLSTDAEPTVLEVANAGITWADWGIAETGSIVLHTAPGRRRLVSLLPRLHIALLPLKQLVATRGEVLSNISLGDGHWPSNVVIVTGPSRTADIENDLSIGVHGPAHVHVFILE